MDTSDAPPAQDANAAAGFLAPSDLAAAKAQVISKSGKRGWFDWRKCDWDRWGAAPRATAPLEVSEGRAFVCLLYTSPSPRDGLLPRMPSSA